MPSNQELAQKSQVATGSASGAVPKVPGVMGNILDTAYQINSQIEDLYNVVQQKANELGLDISPSQEGGTLGQDYPDGVLHQILQAQSRTRQLVSELRISINRYEQL